MWLGCQGGRSHLGVFSCKRSRAEVGNTWLAGPLSWGYCPRAMGLGLPLRVVGRGCTSPPQVSSQALRCQCPGTD